jgi:hypothetical protein
MMPVLTAQPEAGLVPVTSATGVTASGHWSLWNLWHSDRVGLSCTGHTVTDLTRTAATTAKVGLWPRPACRRLRW